MKKFSNWIPAFAGMTRKLSFRARPGIHILLILILVFGGYLRFFRVNWDSFGAFHPDERNISWAVTRIHFFDQLNPKFFAYGGLPIYLYRAIGESVVRITRDPVWLFDWGHIAVIGRYVSATLSSISILLIFLVGSLYFSNTVGLLSAAFLAFSPWAIEQAHFSTTETMLVFFLLLLLYYSQKLLRSIGSIGVLVVLGIIWGLALAAKTTGILFGLIPLTAIWLPHVSKNIPKKLLYTFLLGAVTCLIFFLFSPYTILDFRHFYESMSYESGVATGRFTVPYTLQFWHTSVYLYQLITMLWQAGPLTIVGLAGLIVLLLSVIPDLIGDLPFLKNTKTDSRLRGNDKQMIIFLIFPLIYFGWVGTWFAKFARYNVPFLPFVTIAAAWFMVFTLQKMRTKRLSWFICLLVYLFICLLTVVWGLMNFTVYIRPQTKIVATQWIRNMIPTTVTIYTEHWNDGLPLDLPDTPSYHRELLNVYDEPDDATKARYLANKLTTGDFVIFSTRRIWATMPRLTDKYPVTSKFYTMFMAGRLGYTEVAAFTSYPQLFGFTINDDAAEESLQVFDHPTVRIFQNTGRLPKEEIIQKLMSSMGN